MRTRRSHGLLLLSIYFTEHVLTEDPLWRAGAKLRVGTMMVSETDPSPSPMTALGRQG